MVLWSPGIKAPGDSPASAVGGLQPGLRRLEANLCGKAQKWSVGCLLDGKQPLGPVCGAREGLQGEAGWEGSFLKQLQGREVGLGREVRSSVSTHEPPAR